MESTLLTKLPIFGRINRNANRYESFPDTNSVDESYSFISGIHPVGIINPIPERTKTNSKRLRKERMRSSPKNNSTKKVQSSETNRLREENEKLKQRLNAANNAIRDLEYVCKKNTKEGDPKVFCSFIPRKPKSKSAPNLIDDRSLFSTGATSQAETVRMGSLMSNKKSKRTKKKQRKKNGEQALLEHQEIRWENRKSSCSQSLLRNRNQRFSSSNKVQATNTAPCTPERSPVPTRSDLGTFPRPRNDIQSRRQKDGGQTYEASLLQTQQRIEKINFLTQVAMKTVPLSRMNVTTQSWPDDENNLTEEDATGQFPRMRRFNEGFYATKYDTMGFDENSSASDAGLEVLYETSSSSGTVDSDDERVEI
jgi:hypothetical protein